LVIFFQGKMTLNFFLLHFSELVIDDKKLNFLEGFIMVLYLYNLQEKVYHYMLVIKLIIKAKRKKVSYNHKFMKFILN